MRKIKRIGVVFPAILLTVFSTLQSAAQVLDQQILKSVLKKGAVTLAVSEEDIDQASISHTYRDENTQVQYVYLQQEHQDIKIFNQIISVVIKDNKVVRSAGKFISGMDQKFLRTTTSIDAATAIQKAAEHLGLSISTPTRLIESKFATEKKLLYSPSGIAKRNIETELVWVAEKPGPGVRLCWNVNIDVLNSPDWWNVRIDAMTGAFVEKDNWTVYENNNITPPVICEVNTIDRKTPAKGKLNASLPPNVTNAAYYVVKFPAESLLYGNFATDKEPWLKAGAGNNAITLGWHFDGTNNYITSQGNNVHAYEDRDNKNLPGNYTSSSTPAPALTFNVAPDFSIQPFAGSNEGVNIINLFYWNNLIHDILYQYGFTEPSGNFQMDNLGRGGLGNDYVFAEAQDGQGVNNAFFTTPVDGASGRMEMYLWARSPVFSVDVPTAISGVYPAIETPGNLHARLIYTGAVTGQVTYYNDDATGAIHTACDEADNDLTGKIALIQMGTCLPYSKILRAQEAGAIAVILVNNVDTLPPSISNITHFSITIPAILVKQSTGSMLAANLESNIMVTLTSGIYADGDIDNGIISHEFGHGVSARLTGGPANASCLFNKETPSEGWSDWFALMLTTDWSSATLTDGTIKRPIAAYAMGQTTEGGGIREVPYTTDMTINPATYADVASSGGGVHDMGEPWAATLWDMTWAIINQVGYINPNIYDAGGQGGNVIALNLVMTGLKLQPCEPGFIDARDAILYADTLLYGGVHVCAIWNAFARRGMGYSASQGLSTEFNDQTPAFDGSNPLVNLEIPDAYAMSSGVLPNTVYIGYAPASSITLNSVVSGGTIPYGYLWSTGATATSITVSPVVNTNYSLTITDGAGCKNTRYKLIKVEDIRAGNNLDKLKVCHNGHTIAVNAADIGDHLAHGDILGSCSIPVTRSSIENYDSETTGLAIKAWPNPSSNYFTLLVESMNPVYPVGIRIMDILGRVIETRENLKTQQTFNFGTSYSPGVYIIEVRNGEERKQLKIVKTGN